MPSTNGHYHFTKLHIESRRLVTVSNFIKLNHFLPGRNIYEAFFLRGGVIFPGGLFPHIISAALQIFLAFLFILYRECEVVSIF